MRRRDLLTLIFAAAPPLLLASDSVRSRPPGTRYYVSPTGDDAATGRDPSNAWRTVNHINSRLADGTIRHPDAVLFEQGQTFYGKLRAPTNAPTDSGYLTFGSYSTVGSTTGDRPVLSSYLLLGDPAIWRAAGRNIWLADLNAPHPGYDGAQGGKDNIGFLNVDGVINGKRAWQPTDLVRQWDFHCSDGALWVWSRANPGTLSTDIKAACDGDCITVGNALWISGLKLVGSGGHGVQGTATDVVLVDNEIAELGGSQLYATTRYGNGFQAWAGSARMTVHGNLFHDIYDVALTAQGKSDKGPNGWSDLRLQNNLIYQCNQSMEFWSEGRGPGFLRCLMEHNTCLYAGYCWSSDLRPDRDTRVHLLTYGWDQPADITVRHNTFYDAALAYRYSATATPGLHCLDNLIAQRPGRLLKVNQPETIEYASNWVEIQDNDQGSQFEVLPAHAPRNVAAALRTLNK